MEENKTIEKREEEVSGMEQVIGEKEEVVETEKLKPEEELQELKDRYLRLYAEFDNYRKRVLKDKEELIKYSNESLLYELLPVIDNLELAVKHSSNNVSQGLVQGVEITLKEFQRVIEKFGITPISALGKRFDPSLHHAMTQVEREDTDEKTVVEEFRKGYMFRDKVLRPSLVAVSKKPQKTVNSRQSLVESQEKEKTEEGNIEIRININKDEEE